MGSMWSYRLEEIFIDIGYLLILAKRTSFYTINTMAEKKGYIKLEDLEVYKLSRELSAGAWQVYSKLNWPNRKIIGDQFFESVDSIGANIAESYGRFHYLDRIRFLYNSRGSLFEAIYHWLGLMKEREIVSDIEFDKLRFISNKLSIKLNNYIQSIYQAKKELK